jgi:chromosome segregation ATPase
MTKSDTLYGVTMDESGVSKMLSISFAEAKKYSE